MNKTSNIRLFITNILISQSKNAKKKNTPGRFQGKLCQSHQSCPSRHRKTPAGGTQQARGRTGYSPEIDNPDIH